MGTLGLLLMAVGGIALLVGWVWLIVEAFKVSALWGTGAILMGGIVGIIFAFKYRERATRPVLLLLGGGVVLAIGTVMGGMSASGGEVAGMASLV